MSSVLTATAVAVPERATTGRWVIDAQHTAVMIRVRMLGVPLRGRFDGAAGVIDVPDDITRSRVSATVRSDSLRTWWASQDRHARSVRPLDAAAEPTLSFSAAGLRPIIESVVTPDGERPLWWLVGELTVMKVSRPLCLALGVVQLRDDAQVLEFGATATLRRSDFGVKHLRGLMGDTVDLTIRGRAHRSTPMPDHCRRQAAQR
jgi:polyisoprenoid-binding protein YceI